MPKCKSLKNIFLVIFAWGLLLISSGLFFAFIWPFYLREYNIGIAIYQAVLTSMVILNYALTSFTEPGYYPKASTKPRGADDRPLPLGAKVEVKKVTVEIKMCTTCNFYKPPRCVHCHICDCCVEVLDHHCYWLNNCIGRRNYKFFFQYLVLLSLDLISTFSLCLFFTLKNTEAMTSASNVVSLVLMPIAGIAAIPIVWLTCFHVFIIGKGRTTYEHINGRMNGVENPYDRGCAKNYLHLFCSPTWPSLLRSNKLVTGSKIVTLSKATYETANEEVVLDMETGNALGNNSGHDGAQEVLQSHQQPNEPIFVLPGAFRSQDYDRAQTTMVAPVHSGPNDGYPHFQMHPSGCAPWDSNLFRARQQFHHPPQHPNQFQHQNINHQHHHQHHLRHSDIRESSSIETKHPVDVYQDEERNRKDNAVASTSASSGQSDVSPVAAAICHTPEETCLLTRDNKLDPKSHDEINERIARTHQVRTSKVVSDIAEHSV